MAVPDYKLSAVLCGHSLDVRCVATTKEYCILSASRDRTAKLWHPEGVKDFVNVVTYKGHRNFVSCVCWLPPCEAYPDGLVVTGGNDNVILGYNLQDGSVQLTLEGHENTVCSIQPGRDSGVLMSSSWDSTAKVWYLNAQKSTPKTLKGHQAAVWSVIELFNGTYATASADKTIKLWKKDDGSLISTLTGHTDCVRGIVTANAETFLSCSNDASIKLWTNKGQCLNTFYGHSNYIYSISINPTIEQGFATCGEDGSVRLWTGGDCVRDIRLPVQSVWSVTCLENGDIVTGSSDGVVRVFTKDPARYADEPTLKAFEEEVQKMQAAQQQEIGGFKLSELPGPEVLLEPGKSDGQTKLVRRGTNVKCYSWSVAENTWNEIGDVMGANPASEGKTMYQGKEYDFVFSVDIKDGAPPIKLPFNKNEDPWVAAQAFIHRHELPQVYLEQVANFIITNAKLDSQPASSNGFADPFTGSGRYIPGSGSVPGLPPPSASDPFTGGGAYMTSAAATTEENKLIPHDSYIRFDQANLKAIHDKLKEFNSKAGDGLRAMTDEELETVVKLGELEMKKSMAKHRQELYRTGGGPSSGADLTEVQEKVLAICSNITGLDARNDSDSIPAPPVPTKDPAKDEKLPHQLLNEIIIVPSDDIPMSLGENDISDGQILKGNSAVQCTENVLDQGALNADQPKQDDIIQTDDSNNWSSWKPKNLKTKINPMLRNANVTKAGVTATLDKLTKARLELVEMQKENTLKEHAFVEEEHHLRMLHLQNDEKRKQELHEILVRQLSKKDSQQTTYNVLNNMKM